MVQWPTAEGIQKDTTRRGWRQRMSTVDNLHISCAMIFPTGGVREFPRHTKPSHVYCEPEWPRRMRVLADYKGIVVESLLEMPAAACPLVTCRVGQPDERMHVPNASAGCCPLSCAYACPYCFVYQQPLEFDRGRQVTVA